MSTRGNGAKWLGEEQRRRALFLKNNADPARNDPRTKAKKELYDLILARVFAGKSKQEIWEEVNSIEEYKNAYPNALLFENATKNTINSISEKVLAGKAQNKPSKEK